MTAPTEEGGEWSLLIVSLVLHNQASDLQMEEKVVVGIRVHCQ